MPKVGDFDPISPREEQPLYLDLSENILSGDETISNPSCTLFDDSGNDISDTNLEGSASEDSGIITSPVIKDLTAGVVYELRFKCTIGDAKPEYIVDVHCEEH